MHRAAKLRQALGQRGDGPVFGVDAVELQQVPRRRIGSRGRRAGGEVLRQGLQDGGFPARMTQHAQIIGTHLAGPQRPQHPPAHQRTVHVPRGYAHQVVGAVEDAQRRQAGRGRPAASPGP